MAEPLLLHHSWPLWEQSRHFDLGVILNCAITDSLQPSVTGELGLHHAGLWECKLADNYLTWSGGVYDIFGFPRGARVARDEALACYREPSRATMERLRAHAIRHKRGFSVDVEVDPVVGQCRSIRLIAAPICEGARVVGLHGLKILI